MKRTFKIISLFLACVMIFLLIVSCSNNQTTQTTSKVETTSTTQNQTQGTEKVETTNVITETTSKTDDPIEVSSDYSDNKVYKVGSYINLHYNEDYCTIESSVEKGLGTSEVVKITVTMKDGYIFDAFTQNDYLPNVPDGKPEEEKKVLSTDNILAIGADDDIDVYLNYSMTVVYHANGGKVKGSDDETVTTTFPLSYYKCPTTLKYGTFEREGYVLSEYAFSSDGDGDRVSLGSRFKPNGSTEHLYCVWEKASDASNFEYKKGANGVQIENYTGNEKNLVIPEYIEGAKVISIGDYAITSDDVERLFVPATVQNIGTSALCLPNMTEIVLHDSIINMKDDAFFDCDSLKTLRINTVLDSFNDWGRATYNKIDRLVWAKDLKKIVIYGGSGSWYGWDCEELTKAFGDKYVIINLGMNANMCSAAFVEGVSAYLNEGDIFLWAPEPGGSVLGDSSYDGGTRSWWFTFSHFDLYKSIDISNYKNVFSTFAAFNKTHANKQIDVTKSSIKENIYGDISATENKMTAASYRFNYFNSWFDYSKMAATLQVMNDKGVKVLFTYAAMAEEGINEDYTGLEEYKANILKTFPVQIISDYKNYTFPIKYFHDSEWHMVDEGAHIRTLRVIEDLKAYFETIK